MDKYKIFKESKVKVSVKDCYVLQFDGLAFPNPGETTGGAVLFDSNKKVICNFTDSQTQDVKRPITNYVYKNIKTPVIINEDFRNFYATRTY